MLFSRRKVKQPLKKRLFTTILVFALCVVIVLIIYLIFDARVSRDYELADSQSQVDASYRAKFKELVVNVNNGVSTGIPTVDDEGVTYADVIEITKGSGDFINFLPEYASTKKTFTQYNNISWKDDSWQFAFAYSKLLHENSTLYETSGVVKLFDRYSWSALGTYFANAYGFDVNTGLTYRINLDNGRSYDIICFDTKRATDSESIIAPNGLSIGHLKNGSDVCLTEFELINFKRDYPVRNAQGLKPEMRYSEWMTVKSDPDHNNNGALCLSMGTMNYIEEFNGNVVSVQRIIDPKVEQLFKAAVEETNQYRSGSKVSLDW